MTRSTNRKELSHMDRELDATTNAVLAGDQAHLAHVTDAQGWERRGLLQRLVRTEGPMDASWRNGLRRR
jgi:hypothetical protein